MIIYFFILKVLVHSEGLFSVDAPITTNMVLESIMG